MSLEQLKVWRDNIGKTPSRIAELTRESMKEVPQSYFTKRYLRLLELFDNGRLSETYLANEKPMNYCGLWFSWRRDRGGSDLMFQSIGKETEESKPILITSDVRFAQSPYVMVDRNGCKLVSFMGYLRRDEERIREIMMALPRNELQDVDCWLEGRTPYFYIGKLSPDNKVLVQPRLVNQSEDALDTLECISTITQTIGDRDHVSHLLEFKRDNRSYDAVRLAGGTTGNIYILRADPEPNLTYPLEIDISATALLLMKTNLDNGFVFEKRVLSFVELPYHKELYFDHDENLHVMVWSDNKFLHRILDQDGETIEEEETIAKLNLGGSGTFIGTTVGPDPKGNVNVIVVDEKVTSSFFTGFPKRFEYRATLFALHTKAKYCQDEYAILGENLQIIRLRYDEKGAIELSVH